MYQTTNNRVIQLYGEIDEKNTKELIQKISEIYEKDKNEWITLYICSFGGSVAFGYNFYDFIRSILKPKLQTVALGVVHSMAAIIFLAGEHRVFCSSASLFVHQFGRTYEKPVHLTIMDFRRLLKDLKYDERIYTKIIQERTAGKISKAQIIKMMHKETYIYASDVVKMGLAHEVL